MGLKTWVLADSETGYTWNFKLYTGKDGDIDDGALLGERVAMKLSKTYGIEAIMSTLTMIIVTNLPPWCSN